MMKNVMTAKAKFLGSKVFFYLLLISVSYGAGRYFTPVPTATASEKKVEEPFSEVALLIYMKELGIKYPETVLSQARLETGNFTSDIFKENNNLFGMKVAEKRPTTAIGVNRQHAAYRNWKDSVVDYALFQSFAVSKLPRANLPEYRKYLQKFYSETSDYLQRLDRMVSPNEDFTFAFQGRIN